MLFADLVGSLRLLPVDPEEAGSLLEDVLERLSQAVLAHGGTVTQAMGDGIMALFGAPTASENHALCACGAALAMREAIAAYAQERRIKLAIRVGLWSGEVIVGTRGEGSALQYTAMGRTAHLASRIQKMAKPGQILIAESSNRLVAHWAETHPLGARSIRGLEGEAMVFELRAMRRVPAPDAGATPFVGRQRELRFLEHVAEDVEEGHGQSIVIVGEPGVGKSRLIREFTTAKIAAGWQGLAVYGVSHLNPAPFSGVVAALSGLLAMDRKGPTAARREQSVLDALATIGEGLEKHAAALLALQGGQSSGWQELSAEQRRLRVARAVTALVSAASRQRPLIVALDDLQWIDADSQDIFAYLMRSLSRVKVLVLAACRPEGRPAWPDDSNYFQLPLESLRQERLQAFMDALLGRDASLASFRPVLIERTGGNPLFLEETVGDLAARGVLHGRRGDFRVSVPVQDLDVPMQVQDVVAMRIDRLSSRDKRTLQVAAVCGYDVELSTLGAVLEADEYEVASRIHALQELRFLDQYTPPGDFVGFRHPLIHDVAYKSLLRRERLHLHRRVLQVVESSKSGEENYDVLAFHALRAEYWEEAARYLRASGENALSRSACQQAVDRFKQALGALGNLPGPGAQRPLEVELRLGLRNALFPLGRHKEILPELKAAAALEEGSNDKGRLTRIGCYMSHCAWLLGRWDEAFEAGTRALAMAQECGDADAMIEARFTLGLTSYSTGRFAESIEHLSHNAHDLSGERERRRLGFFSLPAVVSRGWLSWSLAECGRFSEALDHAREAYRIAREVGRPFDRIQALLALGGTLLNSGHWKEAMTSLEEAQRQCDEAGVAVLAPRVGALLGCARALSGDFASGLQLSELAIKEVDRMELAAMRAICLRWGCETALLAGELETAHERASMLLRESRQSGQGGHEAWALYLVGLVCGCEGDLQTAEDAMVEADRLAKERDMDLLHARCLADLGGIWIHAGQRRRGATALTAARRLCRTLGMARQERYLQRQNQHLKKTGGLGPSSARSR